MQSRIISTVQKEIKEILLKVQTYYYEMSPIICTYEVLNVQKGTKAWL